MTQAIFDGALELKATGAAVTSTGSTTGIAIAARFLPVCDWVVNVTAIDFTTTDETYIFTLEVSNLVGGTYSIVATLPWIGSRGPGKVSVPVSGERAAFMNTTSAFMRVTATLAGTTPSVTYTSYLAKAANRLGTAQNHGDIVTWPA